MPYEEIEALLNLVKADWESIEEVRNRVEHQNGNLARSYLQGLAKHRQWLKESAEKEWAELFQSSAYVQFGGPESFNEFVNDRAPGEPRYETYDEQRRRLLEEELACLEQALRVRQIARQEPLRRGIEMKLSSGESHEVATERHPEQHEHCGTEVQMSGKSCDSLQEECDRLIQRVTAGRPPDALSTEEREEVQRIREFYAKQDRR